MPFKVPDWNEAQRTRVLALVLLLALVVALPVPTGNLLSRQDVALLLIWLGAIGSSWALWFRRDLLDLFCVVAFVGALLSILFRHSWFSMVSLVTWRVWFFYRERRISRLSIFLLCLGSLNVVAKSSTTKSGDDMTYLKGYKLNDLTSCRQVDVVPWSLGEENKQARLLLRDRLRLSSETKYSDWSVFQTMDTDGGVTFIFERIQGDGTSEYHLAKGQVFNRIIKRGKTRSVAEVKNLKNLIDSPALEFFHEDGSQLSFLPGSSGSSKLRVYLASRAGARILPPLYLDGRHCSRPESAFDQDDDPGKKSNAGGQPPTSAPIAGGAASAGSSNSGAGAAAK